MGAEREAPNGPRGLPPYDPAPDPHARARAFLRWGLAGLIVLTPLPFGSVQPLPVLLIELVAAVLGAVGVWVLVRERPSFPLRVKIAFWAVAGIVALGVLQAVPLPAGVVRVLAPPVAEAREAVAAVLPELRMSWFPLSLSPADTWDAVARFVAYALIGVATLAAVRRSRDFLFLGMAFAAAGVFQATYGAAEFLSGRQQIFGYVKKYYLESATGTFINRNHYASMLAMCAPFALGCAAAWNAMHPRRPRSLQALTTALGVLAAATMMGAVALSGSRGGSAAALVGLGAYLLMTGRSWRRMAAVGVLVALPVVFLLWQDVKSPLDRMEQIEADIAHPEGRFLAYSSAFTIARRSLLLGYGLGTFESAFAGFGEMSGQLRYDHLHQEQLQIVIEGGLPCLLLAIAAVALLAVPPRCRDIPIQDVRRLVPSAAAAIIAIVGHSLIDFPTRIPANSIQLSVALAITAVSVVGLNKSSDGSEITAAMTNRNRL